MIEKLQEIVHDGTCSPPDVWEMMTKINEIIDYLNEKEAEQNPD